MDTFSGQLTLMKSAAEGLGISIGGSLVPVLRPLVEQVAAVVQNVVAWADKNPSLFQAIAIGVTVVGALAAGAGLLLIAIGAMAPGIAVLIPLIAGLNIAMLANPAVLIAAAIIGLVAAGVLLYKNWDKVKAAAETVWNSIGGIVEAGINIVIDILNAYTLIQRKTLVALVNGIGLVAKAFGKDLPESVREFTDAIDEGIPHVDIFQETLEDTTVVIADATDQAEQSAEQLGEFDDAVVSSTEAVTDIGPASEDAATDIGTLGTAIEATADTAEDSANRQKVASKLLLDAELFDLQERTRAAQKAAEDRAAAAEESVRRQKVASKLLLDAELLILQERTQIALDAAQARADAAEDSAERQKEASRILLNAELSNLQARTQAALDAAEVADQLIADQRRRLTNWWQTRKRPPQQWPPLGRDSSNGKMSLSKRWKHRASALETWWNYWPIMPVFQSPKWLGSCRAWALSLATPWH